METRVKKYIKTDGSIPFQRWLDRLDSAATARVLSAIVRIKQGNFSRIKWFAGIGEYIIDWGPGYRIYLAKDGQDLIILFGGGTKKHQQVDITRAKMLYEEFKLRKKAAEGGTLWN